MLGMKAYTKEYLEECRTRVGLDLAAYRSLVAEAGNQSEAGEDFTSVIAAFEDRFFRDMVLVLDYFFVHRLRTVEGKDGNALNEVRVLCNSILNNNNIMTAENVGDTSAFTGLNAIKLSPEKSVLRYRPGDEIKLTEADFVRLSAAFFDEMERRFL